MADQQYSPPALRASIMRCFALAFLAISISTAARLHAESPEVSALAAKIDLHVNQKLAEEKYKPAPLLDDSGFLRRVTLDLAGRIPTVAERDAYLALDAGVRKLQTIQRLIASPDFAYHQRDQLDALLLLPQEYNDRWREYLLEAVRENRPWDKMFREIMLPEEIAPEDLRPVAFLGKRSNDLDQMTNDTSVIWFGVNIGCAKCHDHPLVDDWLQAHYYGMSAFFKRTFRTRKGQLSERFEGVPKYTDVGGKEHQANFMFLTGKTVESPPLTVAGDALKEIQEKIKKSEQDDKADLPPRPDFRPRAQFVEMALQDEDKRFFARNMVNRLWARFFGRGLVHPIDQMHSQNPASHPALLDELALDFAQSGYDLRRMILAMVLSDTYGRSVREAEGEKKTADQLRPELFAVAVPRPLTPRQMSLSLRIAGLNPTKTLGLEESENWTPRREQLERQADGLARQLTLPEDNFQVPVTESLWFSNHPSIDGDFLGTGNDRLIGHLKEIASPDEVAKMAVRTVLSRDPVDEELRSIATYLSSRSDRTEQALKQVVWALMGSPEFRFNH
jgi:hypothetical protein